MSGHRALYDIFAAKALSGAVIPDPGNGGTIRPNFDDAVCLLTVGAGAETRSLVSATTVGEGTVLHVVLNQLSGGSCTVSGASFDAEGDRATFRALTVNGTRTWVNQAAVTSVVTDTISEATAGAGVTIDGVLLKDEGIIIDSDTAGILFGESQQAIILHSDADASNEALVIGLNDTSQALHVTDKAASATDWNISATTHPNVYIHSNTTPATDYLRLGDHDGTEADIDVVGGTSLALKIAGTEYASLRVTGLAVGTYVAAGTAGTDQLTLKSTGTAPASTGANVGHLFADFETDDDELFWLSGTVGTVTQLTT